LGTLVALPEGAITPTEAAGVFVARDEARASALVRRLGPNPSCPLYPLVVGRVGWPRDGAETAELPPALYVVESSARDKRTPAPAQRYLEVEPGTARWISEAEALVRLGAIDQLLALGLEDAAVALRMGELDAARVQWLRWRDGLG